MPEEDEPPKSKPIWRKVNWGTEASEPSESDEGQQEQPLLNNRTSSSTLYPTNDIQINIEETAQIGNATLGKLLQRGENLSDIKDRANSLKSTGVMFKKQARKTSKNNWVDDLKSKLKISCIVIGFLLVGVLIILGVIKLFTFPPRPPITTPPGTPTTPGGGLICNCVCPPVYAWPPGYPPVLPGQPAPTPPKPSFNPMENLTAATQAPTLE
jgi:hypothetical protein